jgi:nitrosocyanin
MRGRRLVTAALIVATTGLVLAGCGGGGGEKKESSATTSASGGGAKLNLTTKDFAFDPTTLSAKAGEAVTVTIKNDGQAEHNFSIESLKVSKDIEKGESQTVTFTPAQAGDVQFFCEYHKATKNMVGTLKVT